ncbi:MAG: hypothetical protein ACFCBU_11855 [Cyanophyceae cyanobacterium]
MILSIANVFNQGFSSTVGAVQNTVVQEKRDDKGEKTEDAKSEGATTMNSTEQHRR